MLFYVTLVVATIFLGILSIITVLLLRKPQWAHQYGRLWAYLILFASGVKITVVGKENLDSIQPCIFAANHASQFDIFALYAAIPVQFRWLAKIELFHIPILGQAMKVIGYIPIDRSDRRAAFKSIDQAARKVRQGTSILIFPEGTRSIDGKLQPFKKGGFVLAIKSGRPLVPISICGSQEILAKKSWMIHPGRITVRFGKPVPTSDTDLKDRNRLIDTIYRKIAQNLPLNQKAAPSKEL